MTATPESFTGYQCEDCQTLLAEADLTPLYECSRCGTTLAERRCPDCNIFCGRTGDHGCECGGHVEDVDVVLDHDGTLIPADEWDPDGTLTERNKAAEAARQQERAARQQAARTQAEQAAATSGVIPADLTPGTVYLTGEMSLFTGEAEEATVVRVRPGADGHALVWHTRSHVDRVETAVLPADQPVAVIGHTDAIPADPYALTPPVEEADRRGVFGSPQSMSVEFGLHIDIRPPQPSLIVRCGGTGLWTALTANDARTVARYLTATADMLAAAQANPARRTPEVTPQWADRPTTFAADGFVSDPAGRVQATASVGADDHYGAMAIFRSGSYVACCTRPDSLREAAAQLDAHASRLP